MPVQTHIVRVVFLVLCLSMLALQNGCSNSGSGQTNAPASNANAVSLALSTTSGVPAVVADGHSTIPVRIKVTNGSGVGMAGVPVTFATTDGELSESVVARVSQNILSAEQSADQLVTTKADSSGRVTVITDTNGIGQVLLTASTTAGTVAVTADALGFRTHIDIFFVPGPAARVQLDASPNAVNGSGTSTLTATVTDANGNLILGETVTFTFSTNTSGASLSPTSGTTDSNGQVTVKYTAGTTAGADTVRALATSTSVAGSTSVTVTVPSGGPSGGAGSSSVTSISVVNGATGPIIANGVNAVAIRATVQGTSGPLSNISVTFSTTAGSFAASATTAMAITDASGIATVNLIAPTSSGSATVTASTSGFSASTTVTFIANASHIDLLVSSPQLSSNATGNVTLTALVRDAANNLLSGVLVSFAADSGNIQVTNGTTAVDGTATALLGTLGNPQNRAITVTATTGNLSSTNTVQVVGTTLNVSGATTLVLGATTRLTILLQDSGKVGIQNQSISIMSSLGNPLSATTVMTDVNGQATVDVTARFAGTDTIQVTAPGVTTTTTLSISADNFVIRVPAPAAQVPLNTPQTVTMHWDQAGVNQVGQTINFFATRGNFTTTLTCPTTTVATISATTNANGDATVNICSDNAGPSVISAAANVSSGPSSQVGIEFVATSPASLILQATVTSLAPTQQSIITAVVRDAQDNLVKNQAVSFSVSDVSTGQIAPGFGVTDSFGRASTVFTASPVTSGHEHVVITAATAVGAVTDTITLTVAQQALFVTLGTGNVVTVLSTTQYALPYSALVTDASGNPVANATVELSVVPTRYRKGFLALFFDANDTCTGWRAVSTIRGGTTDPDDLDGACQNEDSNLNGILDSNEDLNHNGILDPNEDRNLNGILDSGEDHNNNGILDPGNVATVPSTVTTDATGFASFNVVYPKQFAMWLEVELVARAVVAGSEDTSRARFLLPGVVTDYSDCTVVPPGQPSPYGIATTCACDDRTDPTCPTLSGGGSVSITAASTVLPNGGGTLAFGVTGGSQTSYAITASAGTLNPSVVNFGQSFTLMTGAAQNGMTITLTALDLLTGQSGTLTLTQP